MRILILSFYFEPDIGPGAFRNSAFVSALANILSPLDEIDVITTKPSRYSNYSSYSTPTFSMRNVNIYRIALPTHKNGIFDQTLAYRFYAKSVINIAQQRSYDMIYASSSRLMTAYLGAVISQFKNIPLYLDLRDIFTNTITDLHSRSPVRVFMPMFRAMESFSVKKAEWVNLISPYFADHYSTIDSSKRFRFFTNGIDECYKNIIWHKHKFKEILYAGNIGRGQDLDRIIPKIAMKLPEPWRIRIIGDGSARSQLIKAVVGLKNVKYEPPVPRFELVKYYSRASILFLHLSDYPAFKDVIPSKLFEYAATGFPIIAGVDGNLANFIKYNIDNACIFPPYNESEFIAAFERLEIKRNPRSEFIDKYNNSKILSKMSEDILNTFEMNKTKMKLKN